MGLIDVEANLVHAIKEGGGGSVYNCIQLLMSLFRDSFLQKEIILGTQPMLLRPFYSRGSFSVFTCWIDRQMDSLPSESESLIATSRVIALCT